MKFHANSSNLGVSSPNDIKSSFVVKPKKKYYSGPGVISFPVKHKRKEEGVTLPSGSYVKAKLMTGIDAPEGKTYPVLLLTRTL